MRIPRIFYAGDLISGQTVILDRNASQHVCRVLRLEAGAQLLLFNGNGMSAEATLTTASPKAASIHIVNQTQEATESDLYIHLGLGISKGDRMDYAIQKAVELGVNEITPVITERTIVRLDEKKQSKKLEHWQGIIVSACEQCGRSILPLLNPVCRVDRWIQHPSVCKLIFDPLSKQTLSELDPQQHASILIGPEGGLSDEEISKCTDQAFLSVRLGPRVLRTETAVVAACSALQVLWGDLG
jgi:16S rRNA (uracil1498-N3)-methyltransferase